MELFKEVFGPSEDEFEDGMIEGAHKAAELQIHEFYNRCRRSFHGCTSGQLKVELKVEAG